MHHLSNAEAALELMHPLIPSPEPARCPTDWPEMAVVQRSLVKEEEAGLDQTT